MKIGLIRHFEVIGGMPVGWMTSGQLRQWLREYGVAGVTPREVDLGGIKWERCFSSDSPRAVNTARALYSGPIIETATLREPDIRPFSTGSLRLPYSGWKWLFMLAWFTSHRSQLEAKRAFFTNVRRFLNELLPQSEGNTLIVSHAGIMMFLRREFLRLGFKGPKFKVADNGRLYIFEKDEACLT